MGIELDKDYPIQPSPPLVSDRYGLRVLRQLSLEEMARLRPDGINDATHNLSQPFSLSDVINNLEETMHSGTRQDDPFFYGNRRLTYLKQIESLIPKDAKAVEEMGLANQQLGEFVNYLIQAVDIVGILTSERRIKAVAYNDKSFFIGNRGFQRFITPQEIDPVTGKLYDSGEFFCLETGHKLEIGPEDGNNIIRYGFYRKSPRTLALLAGHLEEPEDPVSRLALDPNLSVPISTYDQLDRL
ncbi:MAG: hypothetical protein M1289_02550, partial [Patescibacteria group bacterium]|nr:hypothetical protein [Patescibacteria group bacterium]